MTYNKTACIIITLALTIFMASSVMACRRKEQESPASSLPPLTVTFFHTKDDADCILLTQEGCTVMIDTGEKKDAEHILEELAAREKSFSGGEGGAFHLIKYLQKGRFFLKNRS